MSEHSGTWTAVRLRTEYETNPVGLGVVLPRFSWVLPLKDNGQKQTAYRIIVSRKPIVDHAICGEMWDSGKVDSDESVQIAYAGLPLESDTAYYWRVRLWDRYGTASAWSDEAIWTTGLLKEADWSADWISHPVEINPLDAAAAESSDLTGAAWIALPEALRKNTETDVYAGEMTYFRCVFQLPGDVEVQMAWLCGTGDCRAVAFLNGERAATSYHYRYPHWVDVTAALRVGRNVLAYMLNNSEGYGIGVNYAALAACLTVQTKDGQLLRLFTDERWECAKAALANWTNGPGENESWVIPVTEAGFGQGAWTGPFTLPPKPFNPSRNEVVYLRRTWHIASPVVRATLYSSALGVYRAYVNGQPAGDQVLAPGWTDYRKRVMVQAYDVTKLLCYGENAIGLIAAPGWYAGCVAMFGPYQYGIKPYALVQLHVECEDGSKLRIVSDGSWSASRGPVRFADLLTGEHYDARMELPGWSEPGIPTRGSWLSAESRKRSMFAGQLVPHVGPQVRIVNELPAQAITEPLPGVCIVDFGQNVTGWMRMCVSGPQGSEVRMRFAEMLNEDGTVYVTNLRGASATDIYILKGDGVETFEPCATFHGFRYVEVTGYPGRAAEACFTACVVASDTPVTGRLETSDPLVNQLISNIVWGQRDNFLSVPTDCPQRDERLGWTGDAQIFVRTAAYNMETAAFFGKWMDDVTDAQLESGAITNVAPHLGWLEAGISAWGDAVVIVPWTIWRMYGERRILERNFASMCRYMDDLRRSAPHWLRPAKGFGDWLSIEADTPKDLLGTAYFGYCAKLMAEISRMIGKHDEAERFDQWFASIREAFIQAYVREDGTVLGETQTGYVLALHMDLLPTGQRAAAAGHLVADIHAKGGHLSTGFVGVSYLLPVLCEAGYAGLAYRLLHRETFPSWLYSVLQGATTIWERWNGWTKEHGFYSAVMNSFNHYSLGSVGEWMYRYMAGIELDPVVPGFKRILLRPVIGGEFTFVRAEFESMFGTIAVRWEVKERVVHYQVTIPANTEANLILPINGAVDVSGIDAVEIPSICVPNVNAVTMLPIWGDTGFTVPVVDQPGVAFLNKQAGAIHFHLESGTYHFIWDRQQYQYEEKGE